MPYVPEGPKDDGLGALIHLLEEPYHNYWFHLGRFVHAFAKAEAELLFLLTHISGLSKTRAGALFSGERSESARDKINNILDAIKNNERKKRLSKPFSQMAAIGTIRNNIVHWGATAENGLLKSSSFSVSNIDRRPLNPKSYYVSIKDFENMTLDLGIIEMIFSYERLPPKDYPVQMLFQLPWRYTPPQPSPRTNKKRPGPTKRKPQPPS